MSPLLVKWIPHSIAFSFQDWFMPEQDLRPGRASIAARGASKPGQPARTASLHLVWVFYVILLTPSFALCCAPRSFDEQNVRMPRDVTRHERKAIYSPLVFIGCRGAPMKSIIFGVSDFYAQWKRTGVILIIFKKF